jgi:catechol 2,3-dioxygenase-like lactoylglutathione lyase family enzyme
MKPRISIITLGISDLERSRRFYVDGLGLPVRPESVADEVVFIELQGVWLALWSRQALAADAGLPDDGAGFPRFSLAHNLETREEVDAFVAHVESIGGRIVKPLQDTFYGGYAAYFADPDGFLWEVAWNPGIPSLAT